MYTTSVESEKYGILKVNIRRLAWLLVKVDSKAKSIIRDNT